MDNFYNLYKLCKKILENHFYVCGTLRFNRGGPPDLKNIKKIFKLKKSYAFKKMVNLFIYKEKASKNAVSLISTTHNIFEEKKYKSEIYNDNTFFENSFSIDNSIDISLNSSNFKKPFFISDYNNYMG
ncbi:hypothetical protein DMUE_5854 [Dictyocoela muelleri]|nr:hypothetical protein DMUE_5854 [Dictyocoela muelleri]